MERRGPNVTANIWTARIIPIILAGVVGYATYVLVVRLCGMRHYLCSILVLMLRSGLLIEKAQ